MKRLVVAFLFLVISAEARIPSMPVHNLFNPKQLGSSVVLGWYHADSFVGSDGDAVGTWSDSSGNSRDMTQSNATKKPTYKTNIKNGHAVMRFDGGDTVFSASNFINRANKLTVFAVAMQTSVADNTIWANSNTGAGEILRFRNNAGTQWMRLITNSTLVEGVSGIGANNWAYYRVIVRATSGGNGTSDVYVNGVSIATSASIARGTAEGTKVYIGSNLDLGSYLTGDVAEIIFCDGELTALQISQVEAYLKTKYAL